jgi:hypothetical protein
MFWCKGGNVNAIQSILFTGLRESLCIDPPGCASKDGVAITDAIVAKAQQGDVQAVALILQIAALGKPETQE